MAGIHNAIIGTAQSFAVPYAITVQLAGGGGGGGYGWYDGSSMYYTVGGGGGAGQNLRPLATVTPGSGSITFAIGAGGTGGDPSTVTGATSGGGTAASGLVSALAGAGGPGASFFSLPEEGGGGLGGDASYSSATGAFNFTGFRGGDGYIGVEFGYPGGGGGGAGNSSSGGSSAAVYPSGGDGGTTDADGFGRGGGGGAGGDTTTWPGPNLGGNAGLDNAGGWYDPSGSLSPNGGNALSVGDGGGGGSSSSAGEGFGGNGAAGIAIVSYPGPPRGTGGSIFQNDGVTYHVFETSGVFNP